MRSSTAYFAGAGTVIAAIVAGLGGGYLFFSIVSPHPEKHGSSEVSRLERRMSTDPIPATNKGAPEPVPYLDKPQISAAVAEPSQPQQAPRRAASLNLNRPSRNKLPRNRHRRSPPRPRLRLLPPRSRLPPPNSPPRAKNPRRKNSFGRARDADVRRDARREPARNGARPNATAASNGPNGANGASATMTANWSKSSAR